MFGLPFRLLNSQIISELLWEIKKRSFISKQLLLKDCSSLTACLMVRLTKLCLTQGDVRKYSVQNQNAPYFITKVIKLKPFPFKKIKWSLDDIVLAG